MSINAFRMQLFIMGSWYVARIDGSTLIPLTHHGSGRFPWLEIDFIGDNDTGKVRKKNNRSFRKKSPTKHDYYRRIQAERVGFKTTIALADLPIFKTG